MQGPRARAFYTAFAKGSATGIEASGADILSVQLIQPSASSLSTRRKSTDHDFRSPPHRQKLFRLKPWRL
jgi:hypothetical protein